MRKAAALTLISVMILCSLGIYLVQREQPAKVKESFPRVVQNKYGKYAVQIGPFYPSSKNIVYLGVAIPDYQKGGVYQFSTGLDVLEDSKIMITTEADSSITITGKQLFFDTIYNAFLGKELVFDKRGDAESAMNSYLQKEKIKKDYADSVAAWHIYK